MRTSRSTASSAALAVGGWTDPGMEPDPSKWRTKVVWPVKAKKSDG
jgi:hypothetical protein